MEQFFDRDELTGSVETFYFDETEESFTINRVADLQPLVDANHFLANETPNSWKGDWHHVASIPDVIWGELAKTGIATAAGRILDMDRFKAWLNDSTNRAFRTRPGRV